MPQKIVIRKRSFVAPIALSVFIVVIGWLLAKVLNNYLAPNTNNTWSLFFAHSLVYILIGFATYNTLLGILRELIIASKESLVDSGTRFV